MAQMSIARELLRESEPTLGLNPLGMIGLSPEILAIGLTDEELHAVCRRIARAMLIEVHEDRVPLTDRTAVLQRQFSEALGLLDDRTAFVRAVHELRVGIDSQKNAIAQARRDARDANDRVAAAEQSLTEALANINKERTRAIAAERRATRALERAKAEEVQARTTANRLVATANERAKAKLSKQAFFLQQRKSDFHRRLARLTKKESELRLLREKTLEEKQEILVREHRKQIHNMRKRIGLLRNEIESLENQMQRGGLVIQDGTRNRPA